VGYLQIPAGIADFDQAVISFWFRVPQESIDAASSQPIPEDLEGDVNWYFPALVRTIPLLTFGSIEAAVSGYGDGSGAYPTSPSYIGVDCTGSRNALPPANTLCAHLAMSNSMTFTMTPMASDGAGSYGEPQFLHTLQRKDSFFMAGNGDKPYVGGQLSQLVVTPDTWHHVLISFDLTSAATVIYSTAPQSAPPYPPAIKHPVGGPTFMWAFDDVDRTDWSLSPSCAQVYNVQPPTSVVVPPPVLPYKQITTNNLIDVPGGAWAFIATWSPVPIKSLDNAIGIPSSAEFVDNIYRVEMADFQLFTGVTLDVSVEENRRAFVSGGGQPVIPTAAATLLGQSPKILLHRSSDWIAGSNSGSHAVNFDPTGTITPYDPQPALE
jgi:hypothetical protein